MIDEWNEWMDDQHEHADLQAAAQLETERHERCLAALYEAAMLGLPDEDLRVLCSETGIAYADLEAFNQERRSSPNEQICN